MASMLEILKIPLDGRHHSGIDDCRNIAKISQRMVKDGHCFTEKSYVKVDAALYKTNAGKKKFKDLQELKQQRLTLHNKKKI